MFSALRHHNQCDANHPLPSRSKGACQARSPLEDPSLHPIPRIASYQDPPPTASLICQANISQGLKQRRASYLKWNGHARLAFAAQRTCAPLHALRNSLLEVDLPKPLQSLSIETSYTPCEPQCPRHTALNVRQPDSAMPTKCARKRTQLQIERIQSTPTTCRADTHVLRQPNQQLCRRHLTSSTSSPSQFIDGLAREISASASTETQSAH